MIPLSTKQLTGIVNPLLHGVFEGGWQLALTTLTLIRYLPDFGA
jgi:hypothetical protein